MTTEPTHKASKKEWNQEYHKINFVSECVPQLSITVKYVSISVMFSQCYKQITVQEVSLQSIHLLWKVQAFSMIASQHSHGETISC